MKITFVYHSCYVVELEKVVFVFDYFKGELPRWSSEKEVIFFVSHKHQDHFSLDIFKMAKQFHNVQFVLSNDIKFTDKFLIRHGVNPKVREAIVKVGSNVSTTLSVRGEELFVDTLKSTDEGVAFIITYMGKTFYHAGDLNWWSWSGETKEENDKMEKNYITEVNKLSDRKVDVAFVVLDPRQEERYWWGLDYFLKTVDANMVFPMHCWEKYEVVKRFLKDKALERYCGSIMKIEREGDSFTI